DGGFDHQVIGRVVDKAQVEAALAQQRIALIDGRVHAHAFAAFVIAHAVAMRPAFGNRIARIEGRLKRGRADLTDATAHAAHGAPTNDDETLDKAILRADVAENIVI